MEDSFHNYSLTDNQAVSSTRCESKGQQHKY